MGETGSSDPPDSVIICGDLNTVPGSHAYKILCNRFTDAGSPYVSKSFTSIKPDTFSYKSPRGFHERRNQWNFHKGRCEVLDYIFYDSNGLELSARVGVPHLSGKAKSPKPPDGFWSGDWAFASSPVCDYEENLFNPAWRPQRVHGKPAFGIPNRLYGSDHIPIRCKFNICDVEALGVHRKRRQKQKAHSELKSFARPPPPSKKLRGQYSF